MSCKSKGFTLIELLVVIGVSLAVFVVVGGIIFSTLRGTQKTVTLEQVRQNGNHALSVMSKNIRNAKSLDFPSLANCLASSPLPVGVIRLTPQVGNQTRFVCDNTNKTIASNSSSLLDTTKVSLVSGTCSFTCTRASSSVPPTIKIKFRLAQFGSATFVEQKASVDFETTVTLRNP